MKVTAFNGSPRKDGNTAAMLQHVFDVLDSEGIEHELVQVGGNSIHGCTACYQCVQNKTEMIIPGSCYWNMGIGREKGDVEGDEEGVHTMRVLGENMEWVLKKLG